MAQDDVEYHSTRAQKELNFGLVAEGMPAARAHLQLSTLHMQRVRELRGRSHARPILNM